MKLLKEQLTKKCPHFVPLSSDLPRLTGSQKLASIALFDVTGPRKGSRRVFTGPSDSLSPQESVLATNSGGDRSAGEAGK